MHEEGKILAFLMNNAACCLGKLVKTSLNSSCHVEELVIITGTSRMLPNPNNAGPRSMTKSRRRMKVPMENERSNERSKTEVNTK